MAGLLDIFGTGGLTELGLLGVSPEEINRYRDDAQAQALYKLAENMFAGGPTGASIAKGLAQGQQAYKEAMRGGMTDLVTQQKLAESVAARNRAAGAQKFLTNALQPKAMVTSTVGTEYGPDNRDIGGGWSPAGIISQAPQAMEAKLVQPSLQELIPQFAKFGTEGFDALKTYADVLKSGRPETVTLGEGQQLFERQPDNSLKVVGGAPKSYRLTGNESNIALRLFGTNDPSQLTPEQNARIGALAEKARKDSATVVYPPGALAPDKGVVKDIQSELLSSGNRLSSYNSIDASFRPEYLQPAFRAGQAWSSIKEKAGADLAPEQQKQLADFSKFKQTTVQQLNAAIKEQTGATMGVQEGERIISGLPNAGTGTFDGDSPTEFKAKLDNSLEQLRRVEARNAYVLRKGLSFKDISLDDVPSLINKRANELAQQYSVDLKKASPTQLKAIKRQLAVEFGITSE